MSEDERRAKREGRRIHPRASCGHLPPEPDDRAGRSRVDELQGPHSGEIPRTPGDQTARRHRLDETQADAEAIADRARSEEHTSELQSLMRISYAVFCLKKKTNR